MTTAHAEAIIEAPIERVWQVMMDLPRYGDWNPFTPRVDCPGGPKVGAPIALHVRWADGKGLISNERIVQVDAPAPGPDKILRACYAYNFGGPLAAMNLVRSHRTQELEQLPDGRTRYRTHIQLTGLFAGFAPIKKVQDGFDRQTAGLKQHCEKLAKKKAA
ncbi:MAG: SRPBCC domain-containing protein [Gammaproteobacteria bacterium]|nr:SRPBCC domain-containing protein [Gammaproteobacteria bacterium]